jgi:hypothetical protein
MAGHGATMVQEIVFVFQFHLLAGLKGFLSAHIRTISGQKLGKRITMIVVRHGNSRVVAVVLWDMVGTR